MSSKLPSVLSPYTKNKNTGNVYEIATALSLLRSMGLKNAELDEHAALLESIAVYNSRNAEKIRGLYAAVRETPVGAGLIFDGKPIVDIVCVTQDDGAGRTGDFLLLTSTGESLSLSVCEGKPKKGGVIEKCISNPTATRYGCTVEDLAAFDAIQARAVVEYKAEMATICKTTDESAWPSRVKTKAAVAACSEVATAVASRFASLSGEAQLACIADLLRIEDGKKPADYLAFVDGKTLIPRFYRFEAPTVPWAPTIRAKGIDLLVENDGKIIASTQVKFNNGVYHKGVESSIRTSWNATCCLSELFTMTVVVRHTNSV
jgi:hypothetical protein